MKPISIILPLLLTTWSPLFGLSQQSAFSSSAMTSLQDGGDAKRLGQIVEFSLLPSSRLWLEGTTSVNSFGCEAQRVVLDAKAVNLETINASVDIEVGELECGRGRMNRDLQKAMRADEYPQITYRLESAAQLDHTQLDAAHQEATQLDGIRVDPSESEAIRINAIGFLTVAGVERKVELLATAFQSDDDRYRISGSLPIRMTEYSINPPRALGGLIRVRDEIVVQFDLIIAASTTSTH